MKSGMNCKDYVKAECWGWVKDPDRENAWIYKLKWVEETPNIKIIIKEK